MSKSGGAQFTPGPWVIEKGWNGDRPTITAKVSKTQVIDNRGLIADLEHTPFIEHAQANATLIAAAPAMYEALETVPLPKHNEAVGEFYTRFYAWYEGQRKQALAQAEGREG